MVDRIGASARPASIPDRNNPPGPILRGPLDPDSRYPVGPLPPAVPLASGAILDGPDAPPSPPLNPALQALADAMAEIPNAGEPSAMRPNQVFLSRQLTMHPPDAAMMAASWMVMVRTYGQQRAAWLEQSRGQHVPSSLFMADQHPSAVREGRAALPLVTESEPWRFAVYGWGAERLVLKVVVKDEEPYQRQSRKRPRVALRLDLMLPGSGRVAVQLEPTGANRVTMEVGTSHTSAIQTMRDMLPRLAAMINRCGLTVVRCQLRRELTQGLDNTTPTPAHTALLTAPLFKAMAEVAVALSRPQSEQLA